VDWRKLHREELHDYNCSPYITGVIKSRRMKCLGHVAHVWDRVEVYTGFWWGNLRQETTVKTRN
jgi:hypothetical protein